MAADVTDPLDLDEPLIAADQRAAYEQDGFVVVPGAVDPPALHRYRAVLADVASSSSQRTVPLGQRTVYQQAFLQEVNLWQRRADIRPLVFSVRLARMAADLLGAAAVRLYHDQALVKEAGGGRTPWHCDQYYWPLATEAVITAWIPLQPVPEEMGPLAFRAGSHRVEDLGRELDISAESEARITGHRGWRSLPEHRMPFALGDVSFHAGWTFHGATPNATDDDRLVMTMIYFADGTALAEPTTPGQQFDRKIWLPDSEVGRPIDSWLNPVVWSSDGRHRGLLDRLPAPERKIGTYDLDG